MGNNKVYNRSEARRILPSLIDEVNDSGSVIYISERGQKQAALISYKMLNSLKNDGNQIKKILPFAGFWSDRIDMGDSVMWVNNLRKKSERKF